MDWDPDRVRFFYGIPKVAENEYSGLILYCFSALVAEAGTFRNFGDGYVLVGSANDPFGLLAADGYLCYCGYAKNSARMAIAGCPAVPCAVLERVGYAANSSDVRFVDWRYDCYCLQASESF